MADSILTFFLCLFVYRTLCAWNGWQPWPLVQITINNYGDNHE